MSWTVLREADSDFGCYGKSNAWDMWVSLEHGLWGLSDMVGMKVQTLPSLSYT